MAKYEQLGIKLFAETDQLKGSLRFAADEFLREDQCLSLADLAKVLEFCLYFARNLRNFCMATIFKKRNRYVNLNE